MSCDLWAFGAIDQVEPFNQVLQFLMGAREGFRFGTLAPQSLETSGSSPVALTGERLPGGSRSRSARPHRTTHDEWSGAS